MIFYRKETENIDLVARPAPGAEAWGRRIHREGQGLSSGPHGRKSERESGMVISTLFASPLLVIHAAKKGS